MDTYEHEVLALTQRYLRDVVEALNACPFARRSREAGRTHLRLFRPQCGEALEALAERAAQAVAAAQSKHPDAEAVLLVFAPDRGHPFAQAGPFEAFLRQFQAAHRASATPPFYSVAFHPELSAPEPEAATPANLVPALRRSPYPLIQCLRADVMDEVRHNAQVRAQEKLNRELGQSPGLSTSYYVFSDPTLSAEIATQNHRNLGNGAGREELERRIKALLAARDAVEANAVRS